jgi:hypothetical protein
VIVALAVHTARRLGEIGFAAGALGGLSLIADGVFAGASWRSQARLLGAILVTIGFGLGVVYVHWS